MFRISQNIYKSFEMVFLHEAPQTLEECDLYKKTTEVVARWMLRAFVLSGACIAYGSNSETRSYLGGRTCNILYGIGVLGTAFTTVTLVKCYQKLHQSREAKIDLLNRNI